MKPEVAEPKAQDLYDEDFFEWTLRNAELLRAGRFAEADIAHIAEELEDMGKRHQHELSSRLRVLLTHLLKWQIQVLRRSGSWRATIDTQRQEIADLLRQMPSLRNALQQGLPEAYPRAVNKAAGETGLAPTVFPPSCPFRLEQILDATFFPG